ncbi:MAG: azurin [Bacteroidota bacterium]
MKTQIALLFTLCLFVFSCGGDGNQTGNDSASDYSTPSPNLGDVAREITLELGSNDQMRYDKSLLRVKEGQQVTLVLTHTGEMSKSLMGHNFVLLKKGTDIDRFAAEAQLAVSTDYIPESDAIIAHTEMIGGGETTRVVFDAPAKGSYDYICTFPAHYGLMRGKFLVE